MTEIENFVERFYINILGRASDTAGLEHWSNSLENASKTADDIANGFFNSTEFLNKSTSNSQFVDIAYRTLLGREADDNGKAHWLGELENGRARNDILDGFIYSNEFAEIASTYGVEVGTLESTPVPEPDYLHLISGSYDLLDLELTTPDGSYFFLSSSDLSSINVQSDLDISLDVTIELYLSGGGVTEYLTGEITSVTATEIYAYDSYDNETESIEYELNNNILTLHDESDGYYMSMDWVLI